MCDGAEVKGRWVVSFASTCKGGKFRARTATQKKLLFVWQSGFIAIKICEGKKKILGSSSAIVLLNGLA